MKRKVLIVGCQIAVLLAVLYGCQAAHTYRPGDFPGLRVRVYGGGNYTFSERIDDQVTAENLRRSGQLEDAKFFATRRYKASNQFAGEGTDCLVKFEFTNTSDRAIKFRLRYGPVWDTDMEEVRLGSGETRRFGFYLEHDSWYAWLDKI